MPRSLGRIAVYIRQSLPKPATKCNVVSGCLTRPLLPFAPFCLRFGHFGTSELCAGSICMELPDTVGVNMTATEAPAGTPEAGTLKPAGGGVLPLLAGSWL